MTTYTEIANNEIDPESPITTTLMTRVRDNPVAIAEQDLTAPIIRFRRDPFLVNFGNNIDGDLTVSGSGSVSIPIYEADNYVINAGVTLTSTIGLLIIRARTSIIINGTINCRGDDLGISKSTSNFFPSAARAGGGGGGEGGIGAYDGDSTFMGNISGGSTGGDGGSVTADLMDRISAIGGLFLGGGGDGGGPAGLGGGVVILAAPTITISGTGAINVNGEDGAFGGGDDGGGGGGGLTYLIGDAGNITNNGSINYAGGSGFSSGGDGGNGYALTVEL